MNYDFKLESKKYKEAILNDMSVLIPTTEDYYLGFALREAEYSSYVVRIYLDKADGESTRIYSRTHYNSSNSVTKMQRLLVLSDDDYWNYGLEGYRKQLENAPEETSDSNEAEQYIKELKESVKPFNGVKYMKKHYNYSQRSELKKLGYVDFCYGSSYTIFEYLIAQASNGEKMSFEKLRLITIGYAEYQRDKKNNDAVLYYSQYFLNADSIEKIREISSIDSTTLNKLLDIKTFVDNERNEYNRICKITVDKKHEELEASLEAERIKYMVSNGISLQDAFYYVDKSAQKKKEEILDYYLRLAKNDETLTENELNNHQKDILYVARYLIQNIEGRYVETVIDNVLMKDHSNDYWSLSKEIQNHISFLKLNMMNQDRAKKLEDEIKEDEKELKGAIEPDTPATTASAS